MTTHPTIALLPDAARIVTSVVNPVPAEQWENPSPCEGWTARDVLNHLVNEHLWAPELLAGQTVEAVGDRFDGDLLGGDPAAAWRRAASASMIAWAQADPSGEARTSAGPLPVSEYAHQMLLDLTVHGWDIARGAGLPYAPAADAVDDALAYEGPRVASAAAAGIFGAPVPYDGADPFGRLLALLGRDPAWRP